LPDPKSPNEELWRSKDKLKAFTAWTSIPCIDDDHTVSNHQVDEAVYLPRHCLASIRSRGSQLRGYRRDGTFVEINPDTQTNGYGSFEYIASATPAASYSVRFQNAR